MENFYCYQFCVFVLQRQITLKLDNFLLVTREFSIMQFLCIEVDFL